MRADFLEELESGAKVLTRLRESYHDKASGCDPDEIKERGCYLIICEELRKVELTVYNMIKYIKSRGK